MTSSRGKRADRVQLGNETAQMMFAALRSLPRPSDAMTALCSVQAMMVVMCAPKHPVDESTIRAMMENMTDNVVKLIQGEQDGASDPDARLPGQAPAGRAN